MASRFFRKFIIFFIGFIPIGALVLVARYYKEFKKSGVQVMPTNNLSNSISFNAKIQHFHEHYNCSQIELLIIGSSMSLNNVSAKKLQNALHLKTYNFGSWGFKSDNDLKFLKKTNFPNCRKVLIAFNNYDFTQSEPEYNIGLTAYYLNKKPLAAPFAFLNKFNIEAFRNDWEYRSVYLFRSNIYESLMFDECGSVMFEDSDFAIDPKRYEQYVDSDSFDFFHHNMDDLKMFLARKNIQLILAYLPWRKDLLTEQRLTKNDSLANILKADFGNNFIDLHRLDIDTALFCDAGHVFKQGAELITRHLIDSLRQMEAFEAMIRQPK